MGPIQGQSTHSALDTFRGDAISQFKVNVTYDCRHVYTVSSRFGSNSLTIGVFRFVFIYLFPLVPRTHW